MMPAVNDERRGLIEELWGNPWGRALLIAATVAVVSWAVRETAVVTYPVIAACGRVLLPLAIGFTIAYVLTPVVDLLQRWGINRVIGTGVLFTLFFGGGVLVTSMVLPAVVRQSVDLAERTFREQRFRDLDGDGRYDSGLEPRLLQVPSQPSMWYHDRNENGVVDSGENVMREGSAQMAVAPSLAGYAVTWLEKQQHRFVRRDGVDLGERQRALLAVYREQTQALHEVLDGGLQDANDGLPRQQWRTALLVDPAELPPLEVRWERAWPGVTPEQFEAAAATLPEAAQDKWRTVMGWYGRLLSRYRQRLLAGYDLLQGTGDMNSAAPVTGDADENEEMVEVLAEMARSTGDGRNEPALQLYAELQGLRPERLAELMRERLADGLSDGEEEAVEALLADLREAEEGEIAYASKMLQRLRRSGSESSGPVLRDIVARFHAQVTSGLQSISGGLAEGAAGLLTNVGALLGLALDIVLIPIYAFFLALAMPGIRRTGRRYLPAQGRERSMRILHDIERVVAAFFRGRLIVCLICAALVWIGFAMLGVPYAALFGLLIGLATAVPLAGLLFLIPACLLMLVEGGDGLALRITGVLAVYTVVQTLEMTVFTPTIMGREVELHPVTLIVALLLLGNLLGILGLILAVPIAATGRILAREFLLPRLRIYADLPKDSKLWSKSTLLGGTVPGGAEPVSGESPVSPAEDGRPTGTDPEADASERTEG